MNVPVPALTTAQQAAVAKLAYAVEAPGSMAVLCGAAGTGKSLVLAAVARCPTLRGRTVRIDRFPALHEPAGSDRGPADVVLVDDVHLADAGALSQRIDALRAATPAPAIVLAGQGRLLTLLARDSRLESLVRLRVTVPPFSLSETRLLVAARTGSGGLPSDDPHLVKTIHEIAGGIPAGIVRLADLAGVVAEGRRGQPITAEDIEAIHRRLGITAA
jgi:type II secretory pathway predicted ATPase ExeA